MKVQEEVSEYQARYIESNTKYSAFCGGRGSGKTWIASRKSVKLSEKHRNQLVTARTYKDLSQTVIPKFEDCLETYKIPYKINHSKHTIVTDRAKFLFLSCEDPESIRGYTEFNDLHMDEAGWTKKKAFTNLALCMRGNSNNKTPPTYNFTSTPRLGSWFNKKCIDKKGQFTLIQCSSLDNPFISDDEKEMFLDVCSDSEELEQQEIYASLDTGSSKNAVVPDKYFLLDKPIVLNQPVNVGIDFAGQGHDEIVITMSNETGVEICKHIPQDKEPDQVLQTLENIVEGRTLCNIVVDDTGGYAQGFIHAAKHTEFKSLIRRVNFAESAKDDEIYANSRAEMYFMLRKYKKEGFNTTICKNLREECSVTIYYLNDRGLRQLIKKELIKQELGRSPDESDSVCLSTYYPFKKRSAIVSQSPQVIKLR